MLPDPTERDVNPFQFPNRDPYNDGTRPGIDHP